MQGFSDSAGRAWTITINISAIKRVSDLVGVNLANLLDGSPPLLTRLGTDVVLLCDVIFALVKPQADVAEVTDEDFGRSMGGDAILSANDAFWAELTAFFRQLRRTDTARAIERQAAMVQTAVAAVEQRINDLDIDGLIQKSLGDSVGNSPESSELTPAP